MDVIISAERGKQAGFNGIRLIDYNDQLLVPKLRLNMQEPMFWWETQCSEGGKH